MKRKSTLFCLVFALCVNTCITVNAQINQQDSLALVDFYNSTNGPHWYENGNWLTKYPVSYWVGITVTGTRVTEIDLNDNNIAGSLPSSIGNLSKLTILSLSDNPLSGSIPSSIGNLTNLTGLYLQENKLTGSIPSSIGNLANLTTLYLLGNELTGGIPSSLGNLVNLQVLRLEHNQLTGSIPSSLGNLVNLSVLRLDHNQLTGSIPSSLGNLVNLSGLELGTNQLTGSIPSSLGNLVNLGGLNFSGNQLSGSIPSTFGNLKFLGYLNLNDNKLSGVLPSSLGNLMNLYSLLLKGNRLSGSIPSSFSNLANVPINLRYNRFTFDAMEFVAQNLPRAAYAPQKLIPLHQIGNTLSVSAGGTLSNNTYTWFIKLAQTKDTVVIKGDSVFHPTKSGTYRVKVTNSIATQLKLQSDTIVYTAPAATVIASAQNTSQQYNKPTLFAYPNPAKNVLYVQSNNSASFSLLDQSGKILLITSNINGKGSINVSEIGAGLYYLKNNSTQDVQKVVIAR